MSITRTSRCDWRDCDTHGSTAAKRPAFDFIVVTQEGCSKHFYTRECIIRFAAEQEPTEQIAGYSEEELG